MIDISYDIGGRKINPNNVKDALESAFFAAVADGIDQPGVFVPLLKLDS